MSVLVPERRYDPRRPEMMDLPGVDGRLLEQDLRNLRRINRFFGGLAALRRHVGPMLERLPPDREVHILDLATGSADHPVELVRFARSRGRRVRVTAVDANPAMVEISRRRTADYPEIEIRQADLLNLDGKVGKADVVVCSLALHHFAVPDAVRLLATMLALSRMGFIVNDLQRHHVAAWSAWLYAHCTTRNPLTRNDAHLSVLRAFTPAELREMAAEAGVPRIQIHREPLFRLILVGEH